MSDHKALVDALAAFDLRKERWPVAPKADTIVGAAKERLTQLPKKCEACNGTGKEYPADTVNRIGEVIQRLILDFADYGVTTEQEQAIVVAILEALEAE